MQIIKARLFVNIVAFCQTLIAKTARLWHLKSRYLPNAVSQSLRIRLWHLKSRYLPKAVSQSLRIRLSPNSLIRTPVPKAETGKQSQEFGFAEFLSFVPLQRKTQYLRQNLIAKAAKTVKTKKLGTVPEFGFAEFWSFGTGRLHKT